MTAIKVFYFILNFYQSGDILIIYFIFKIVVPLIYA